MDGASCDLQLRVFAAVSRGEGGSPKTRERNYRKGEGYFSNARRRGREAAASEWEREAAERGKGERGYGKERDERSNEIDGWEREKESGRALVV